MPISPQHTTWTRVVLGWKCDVGGYNTVRDKWGGDTCPLRTEHKPTGGTHELEVTKAGAAARTGDEHHRRRSRDTGEMTKALVAPAGSQGYNLRLLCRSLLGTYHLANESILESGFTKCCLILLWMLATLAYWLGAIVGSKTLQAQHRNSNRCFEDPVDNTLEMQHDGNGKGAFEAAIIIPALVRNLTEQTQLHKSVESILSQCTPKQLVVVVDDGSPFTVRLNLNLSNFALLRRSRNGGPAAARNTGAQYALGRGAQIICFLDSDACANEQWLREHLTMQASKPGIYGGWTTSSSLGLVSKLHDYVGTLRGPLLPDGSLLYAPTCNLSVSSACWVLFDESFKSAAFEDVEFCVRQRKQGWKTRLVATALVYHKYETSLFALCKQFYRYGKAEPRMIGKHPEYPDWLAIASTNYKQEVMVTTKKDT